MGGEERGGEGRRGGNSFNWQNNNSHVYHPFFVHFFAVFAQVRRENA